LTITNLEKVNWPFADLTDEDVVDEEPGKKKRGRPKHSSMDQFVIACHSRAQPDVRRYQCSGDGCKESHAYPRMASRVYGHAKECKYLSEAAQTAALNLSADKSLGTMNEEAEKRQRDDRENGPPTAVAPGGVFQLFREVGQQKKEQALKDRRLKSNLLALSSVMHACLPPSSTIPCSAILSVILIHSMELQLARLSPPTISETKPQKLSRRI
jgi:hypothetical protein